MKTIEIKETSINENQLKMNGDDTKKISYIDLIEYTLDIIPQGGFTPKDIRNRNRIQIVIDEYLNKLGSNIADETQLSFEDSDFDNLKEIIKSSRWTIRNKDVYTFLNLFE